MRPQSGCYTTEKLVKNVSLIANRLQNIDSSAFRDAMRKQAQLVDPINLSVGLPEELTPPHIKAAGIHAIETDHTVYTPSNGIYELRDAIVQKLQRENGITTTADAVTVVPGLATGLFLTFAALLDPGDEVIVFDPYFPPYKHLVRLLEAEVICLPTAPSFLPDPAMLEAAITDRTKLIIINSPNNPSGAVYPEKLLRQLAAVAERYNIAVISDEIYEHFTFSGKHFSIGSIYPNTITMNGFSKAFAMTGWRCGYIAAQQEIIDAINELSQYIVFSNSSITQYAALAALQHPPTDNLVDKYRKKRDFVVHRLRSAGCEVTGADGAYYVFFKAPHGMTDLEFVDKATEHNVIILPGRAFSDMHSYVRISYGASMATLERGMDILTKLISEGA